MNHDNIIISDPVIVNLAYISEIDRVPQDLVSRDSLIHSVQKLFEHYDIVFIEGEQGVGKTTLLLDFTWQNSSNTISNFAMQNYKYTHSFDRVIECLYKVSPFVNTQNF
jgi:Cdc6-like AAA superfamily ATPase